MNSRALCAQRVSSVVLAALFLFLVTDAPHGKTDRIEVLTIQASEGPIFERFRAVRALGRSEDPRAFEILVDLLQCADPMDVQVEAAYALGELQDPRAIPVLIETLALAEIRTDGTVSVGRAAATTLREYDEAAVLPLCAALSNPNPVVREQSGNILSWLEDPRAVGPLVEALSDSTLKPDAFAYRRLVRFGPLAMNALVDALEDERPTLRIGAARSLTRVNHRPAADALAELLSDANANVRYEAAIALATLGDSRSRGLLVSVLSDRATTLDYREAQRLTRALVRVGERQAVQALISALAIDDEMVKTRYAWALGEIGDTLAVNPLIGVLGERRVQGSAARALGTIGDRRAVEPLVAILDNGNTGREDASLTTRAWDREAIVWALGELRDPRAVDALIDLAIDSGGLNVSHGGPDPSNALIKIGEPAVDAILAALKNNPTSATSLKTALIGIKGIEVLDVVLQTPGWIEASELPNAMGRDAVPVLVDGLKNPDPGYRIRCVEGLKAFKDPRSVEPLCEALRDEDKEVRRRAVFALWALNDTRSVEPLMRALTDEDLQVQEAVYHALIALRDPAAVPALKEVAVNTDVNMSMRFRAWRATHVLQTRRVPYDRAAGWRGIRRTIINARWRAPTGEVFVVGGFGAVGICDNESCSPMESGVTERLHSIWGTSASDVFAVGERGTVIHYDGEKWSTMTTGTRNDLYRVAGTSSDDVFAIGWAGAILHFDGHAWRMMESQTELALRNIWAVSSNNIFVVGDGGMALRYDGDRWTTIVTPTSNDLVAIWGDTGGNIYAAGAKGTLLNNWKPIEHDALGYVHSIWGADPDEVYVDDGRNVYRLAGGTITRLLDLDRSTPHQNGARIDSMRSRVIADMDRRSVTVHGARLLSNHRFEPPTAMTRSEVGAFWSSNGILLGIDDDHIRYFDDVDWFEKKIENIRRLIDISGVTRYSFYALGRSSQDDVIHFSGSEVRDISPGTRGELRAIWAGSDEDVYVVGDGGLIMWLGGKRWKRLESPTEKTLFGVWGSNGENIFAVGREGTILHYDGRQWKSQKSKAKVNLNGVWGLDEKHVYAVGEAGVIIRFDGRRWRKMDSGVASHLMDIWGTDPDNLFACGSGGVIVHFDGKRWTQMYTGTDETFQAIGGSSSTKIFAASRHGLHYYYDSTMDVGVHSNLRGTE